jgi:hypothetical protein
VKSGKMTTYSASRQFGIPRTTIVQRIKGKTQSKIGRPTIFNEQTENEIENWIMEMATVGMPVTKKLLIKGVTLLAQKLNVESRIGSGQKWARGFFKRHPRLSSKKAQTLAKHRTLATKEEIVQWFQKISTYFEQNSLNEAISDPNRVWNLDESAFDMCPPIKNAIGVKSKRLYNITANSDKEKFSVMITLSASGILAPPLVLYPYERRIPPEIAMAFPNDWVMGKSAKGYQTAQTFYDYISIHFLQFLKKNGIKTPVILFLDGHRSHLTLELGQFCSQNGIIIVCLPPNSTHFIQPLDRVYFRPVKSFWADAVTEWRYQNGGGLLPKSQFASLLKTVIDKAQESDTMIKNGFKSCGLFPFEMANLDLTDVPLSIEAPKTEMIPDFGEFNGSSMETNEPVREDIEKKAAIEALEDGLSTEQILNFHLQRNSLVWNGPAEEESLFYYWRTKINKIEGQDNNVLAIDNDIEIQVEEMQLDQPSTSYVVLATSPPCEVTHSNQISNCASTSLIQTVFPDPKLYESHKIPKTNITQQVSSVVTSAEYIAFLENKKAEKEALENAKIEKREARKQKLAEKQRLKDEKQKQPKKIQRKRK